jgi:hypothetical protein
MTGSVNYYLSFRQWLFFPPAVLSFLLTALTGCQEFEKQVLMSSEVISVSDSAIVTESRWIDIAGEGVSAYGVCWGLTNNPTVADNVSVVESAPQDGTTLNHVIRTFESNKTYFVRAFVKLQNGEYLYSKVSIAETGEVLGRWTKLNPFFKATQEFEIIDYDLDGIYDTSHFIAKKVLWFPTGAFYGNTPFFGGGIYLEGISTVSGSDTITYGSSAFIKRYNLFKFYEDNAWNIRVAYPGQGYRELIAHVVDNFLYMGLGSNGGYEFYDFHSTKGQYQELSPTSDFYAYDLANDLWIPRQSFPGPPRVFATSFVIGRKIYVCSGWQGDDQGPIGDLWIYDIDSDEWSKGPGLPGWTGFHKMSFVVDGKGYVGGGFESFHVHEEFEGAEIIRTPIRPINSFFEYDPATNAWIIVASLPGEARGAGVGFGIQHHGYVGLGLGDGEEYKDFWRYTPATNTWKQMPDFPGSTRAYGVGFSNETKGCVGLGNTYNYNSDVWIYDPSKN